MNRKYVYGRKWSWTIFKWKESPFGLIKLEENGIESLNERGEKGLLRPYMSRLLCSARAINCHMTKEGKCDHRRPG